ncbi:MAG: cobyric acid synthase, partial [Candidatus Caldatribacteriaceae bacterium]
AQGEESARAQILQALAGEIEPEVSMNPILLKPQGGAIQVIVRGKVWKTISPFSLHREKDFLRRVVAESFLDLVLRFDLVVAEGMGSPVEINLREGDIANMDFARSFHCPVVLVGDIERGGVFASLYGTWALLSEEERALLRGFIINKLHGEKEILRSGIETLQRLTQVPTLGILPYREFFLDDEDSLNLRLHRFRPSSGTIRIGVVNLPHLANTSDFQPLFLEQDVSLSFVSPEVDFSPLDLLILPGTKNTMADLSFLQKCQFGKRLQTFLDGGGTILGICGGFQMLGFSVRDPEHIESSQDEILGFSLFPMVTEICPKKILRRVQGFWVEDPKARMTGYEIHQGRSILYTPCSPFFFLDSYGEEGVCYKGRVFGTYCHGIFDQPHFRRTFLNFLRAKKGLLPVERGGPSWQEYLLRELDALAEFLEEHLDFSLLSKMAGL